MDQHVDLKNLCAKYGFSTQGEIAKAMNTTQQSVAYLLNNADNISMKKLRELCEAIGCNDMREAFSLPDGSTPRFGSPLMQQQAPDNAPDASPDNNNQDEPQDDKSDESTETPDFRRLLYRLADNEVICPNCGKVLTIEKRNIAFAAKR